MSLNKMLNHLEEWLIAFMMGAATIVIFVSVVHRYASGIPWPVLQDWRSSTARPACWRPTRAFPHGGIRAVCP